MSLSKFLLEIPKAASMRVPYQNNVISIVSPTRATWPAPRNFMHLTALTITCDMFRHCEQSSRLFNILECPVTSFPIQFT